MSSNKPFGGRESLWHVYGKKKEAGLGFFFAPSVGISEEVALITRRFDVTAGRGLYDRSDVGDRAMWGSARWESRVDKGAGVC